MQENKRRVGDKYERLAAEHLQRAGYRIRERNFRCKFGEVDLIAEKDGYLVFGSQVPEHSPVRYTFGGGGRPETATDL